MKSAMELDKDVIFGWQLNGRGLFHYNLILPSNDKIRNRLIVNPIVYRMEFNDMFGYA